MSIKSAFSTLASQIENQFDLGNDKNPHSLDSDSGEKFGSLGDYASQIDQSAQRKYVEQGYLRNDAFQTSSKQFEVYFQNPRATMLVKKRMFSSIAENFRPDFMDKDEKLFFRAIKILFQNKCKQISAFEKLSKIEEATSLTRRVDSQLIPIIMSLTDSLSDDPSSSKPSDLLEIVNRLRRTDQFSKAAQTTSWIVDGTTLFSSLLGLGTGVVEITNFSSFNTTTQTSFGGKFNVNISDPYEMMRITEYDIEKAISDASAYGTKSIANVLSQLKTDSLANFSDLITRLNQIRSARGASAISFKVDDETLFGQRITAIVDRQGLAIPFQYSTAAALTLGLGGSLTIADPYLYQGEVLGEDGIDKRNAKGTFSLGPFAARSEYDLFSDIIKTKLAEIAADHSSTNKLYINNASANYARKNLMNSFLGRLVIQSMDTIHIYVDSQTRKDSRLTTGISSLYSGVGMLQNLDNSIVSTADAFTSLFNPKQNINFQLEKATFVGPDFPNTLWNVVRSTFTGEKEGAHIFAGVVESANQSYSDGKWSVAVNGTDNSYYFDQGLVNFKPGVDAFNGAIFDPLTPFKTSFDTESNTAKTDAPELLEENKAILLAKDSFVKLKTGRYPGYTVTKDNYIQDQEIDPQTGRVTRTIHGPDGLVYKWKEGVGILTQFGQSQDLNNFNKVGTTSIYNNPFAGQDIMNVLSLLITGTPYNFATYWNAVVNNDSYKSDPQANKSSAGIYTAQLNQDLIKRNSLWGNFVPFKTLLIDEETYKVQLNNQAAYVADDASLQDSILKLQQINEQSVTVQIAAINGYKKDITDPVYKNLKSQADQLQDQINRTIANLEAKRNNSLDTVGNDVSLDVSSIITGNDDTKSSVDPKIRQAFRRQLNFLTRRPSYQVRGNEDKNLLIVDDFYDKDFDLLAFDQGLENGVPTYNGQFSSVKSQIETVAQLLNLEVFCDTQGHVRIRPPQYNRMPSSVFYKMMQLKKEKNIQIFPEFLNSLFKDQLQTLQSRLEVIEDYIRLDCAAAGFEDDISAGVFINDGVSNSSSFLAFLTNQGSGLIEDMADILASANPAEESADSSFSFLNNQANTKRVFDNVSKAKKLLTGISGNFKLSESGFSVLDVPTYRATTYIDTLINRIFVKSGQRVPRDYFVLTQQLDEAVAISSEKIDFFKILNDLSEKITERQKVLKLLASSIKSAAEFRYVDENKGNSVNRLLTPSNYGSNEIPEVFAHMIEDETYDDLGLGSGNRYIIRNSQIKSVSISDNKPNFTAIEVHGILNTYKKDDVPVGLNSFPQQGNGVVSALAVDYSLWRNFGFSFGTTITVPFLSDPNTQCAPYAASLLARERKNIFRGSVTIIGNEFMQPGEVVFLESHGMLFYVTQVSHSFTFGSSFTTTLTLTYGHVPGDYIPTTLDIIGKLVYKNRDVASYTVQRYTSSSGKESLGVLIRDPNTPIVATTQNKSDAKNSNSDANVSTLKNIIFNTLYKINNAQQAGRNQKFTIELRLYGASEPTTQMKEFREAVKSILLGQAESPVQLASDLASPTIGSNLSKNDIVFKDVDLTKKEESDSPSQKALDASRSLLVSGSSSNNQDYDRLKNGLINCVLDCFIVQTETNGN